MRKERNSRRQTEQSKSQKHSSSDSNSRETSVDLSEEEKKEQHDIMQQASSDILNALNLQTQISSENTTSKLNQKKHSQATTNKM